MKRSDEVRRVLRANLLVLGIFAAACYRTPSSMTDSGDPRCLDCNVILISIDTLRADHLSCYGYPRRTSPEIDRFAKESSVFSQVVSTGGGTLPVHLSMMTSLPPTVHDVWPRHPTRLAEARVTLAEELRSRGYATAGFVDSGWMLAKFGFDQGFDVYDDAGGHFKKILPKAVDWLEEHRRSKFFLFLHTYDVHSAFKRLPYDSPDPYNDLYTAGYLGPFWGCRQGICASRLLARMNAEMTVGAVKPHEVLGDRELAYIVALYDGGINHVDDQIGKILRKIRNLGLERNTIVALTSDHGEEFLEHGRLLHSQYFE
ncbi:MAG: sulfatase, partial [Candidatus Binatia bacterium]